MENEKRKEYCSINYIKEFTRVRFCDRKRHLFSNKKAVSMNRKSANVILEKT